MGLRGIRTDRYTMVIKRNRKNKNIFQQYILYDNQQDPYQLNNIAGQNKELVQQLKEQLHSLLERNNDPWLCVSV